MRLDKLTGAYLLILPGLWSILLSSKEHHYIPWFVISIYILGTMLMRSASCIINDMIDRNIDKELRRTKDRPLASGNIHIIWAFLLLTIILATSIMLLFLFNKYVLFLGYVILLPMVIYPYMKRITYWPHLWLALMNNWGILIGWAAIEESLSITAYLLYAAAIFWALGYDIIYSLQDKHEGYKIGIKSSPAKLGGNTKRFLYLFYALSTILFWIVGVLNGLNVVFHICLVIAFLIMMWQIVMLESDQSSDCRKKYESNIYVALVLLVGIALG